MIVTSYSPTNQNLNSRHGDAAFDEQGEEKDGCDGAYAHNGEEIAVHRHEGLEELALRGAPEKIGTRSCPLVLRIMFCSIVRPPF